jgi:hypothetical protein
MLTHGSTVKASPHSLPLLEANHSTLVAAYPPLQKTQGWGSIRSGNAEGEPAPFLRRLCRATFRETILNSQFSRGTAVEPQCVRGSAARYVQKYGGVILWTAKSRRRMRIDSQINS